MGDFRSLGGREGRKARGRGRPCWKRAAEEPSAMSAPGIAAVHWDSSCTVRHGRSQIGFLAADPLVEKGASDGLRMREDKKKRSVN